MVYSPCQPWNNVYKPEIALERGTLFKDLDLPFEAADRRGGCR
ncbi:MAG: spore coat associated protein CotJA [Ruminococcaceae bacterium]|nr:spore coat associated protein CotJA [Oscillospiraceae bacterium]